MKTGYILFKEPLKFVKKNKVLIRPNEKVLLSTVENVTIAKKAYETFYDIVEKQLYLKVKNFFTWWKRKNRIRLS